MLLTHLRLASLWITTLAAGCVLGPKEVGNYSSTDASTTSSSSDGMSTEPAEPATTSTGPSTTGITTTSTTGVTTTSTTDITTTSTTGVTTTSTTDITTTSTGEPGTLHPACDMSFPDPAPALPPINVGPDDKPRFNDWTELGCESLDAKACDAQDPTCAVCLRGVEDGPGVCTLFDVDIWCDGEGEALGYGDGSCWVCSSPDVRAFACCNFPEGYDCRTWPYPSDGPPGSICARHEDCEPGLVCGPHRGSGYGICQCPGILDPESVAPSQSCFQQ